MLLLPPSPPIAMVNNNPTVASNAWRRNLGFFLWEKKDDEQLCALAIESFYLNGRFERQGTINTIKLQSSQNPKKTNKQAKTQPKQEKHKKQKPNNLGFSPIAALSYPHKFCLMKSCIVSS